jgi:hypothetical protein
MTKTIGLYYELYDMQENYFTFVEFENKIDRKEVKEYIFELKQKLPHYDTNILLDEIDKKYKIKYSMTLSGDEFIGM